MNMRISPKKGLLLLCENIYNTRLAVFFFEIIYISSRFIIYENAADEKDSNFYDIYIYIFFFMSYISFFQLWRT